MSSDPIEPTGLELTVLSLCDFASVREGLLNVVSGGITRITMHAGFPSTVDAHLAMSVYVQPHMVGMTHTGRVILRYPDTMTEIARIDFEFSGDADRNPGEGLHLPFAIPMRAVVFPQAGQVDVSVSLDDAPAGLLSFWVNDSPT